MTAGVVFHQHQGDEMSIDQHIEELRVELRNAVYRNERREIQAELELTLAEREVMLAEAYGEVSAEPPF
jgi:hypothetical protein